jgi:Na+-transporting NADH:ubiquinone oxidoreductase subunit A
MTKVHHIKRGFDIRIAGGPDPKMLDAAEPLLVAVETADFPGVKPKPLVEEGETVRTGQPLFLDKSDRELQFCSPATGTVKQVEFGERRFLQRVVVEPGPKEEFHAGPKADAAGGRDGLISALKQSGLWPLLRQRPIGRLVRSAREPVAVFVNGMDTEPLAADPAFATKGRKAELQAGIDLLGRLCAGPIYLTLRAAGDHQSDLRDLKGVEVHDFKGPHPAGLVGTHIQAIRPLRGDEAAWYLKAQELALLGQWARTGRYPTHRVVAVAGSRAPARHYFKVRQGAILPTLTGGKAVAGDVRAINGTVLTGRAVATAGHLGFYAHTLTLIPEGEGRRDLFGWALPQFGKHSFHRSVLSWLLPRKEYDLDAQLNGGRRAIINLGAWESVMPLDIHPTFLVRAIQAGDLEEAIKLGLLEVTEEDVALCTFVDPCKIEIGEVVRQGLDLFEKEA